MRRFYKKAVFIVDSKPFKVCQPARGNRNTMGKTCPEKAPDFGYCAAQALYYFEDRKPFHKPFAKGRKRLETSFSQFTDQFNIMRNYAKD